jgi:hypothetical protein
MKTPKHTPGPWSVYECQDSLIIETNNNCKSELAKLEKKSNIHAEQNARLIAAAPELLEALEMAHALLLEQNKEYLLDWNRENRTKIMRALTKATGGESF